MLKSAKGPLLAAALVAGMTGLSAGDAFAQASSPNQIVGVWEAEDGIIKLEVFDARGSYSGRMIYGKLLVEADGKTFKKDTHNPDPKLRSRSLETVSSANPNAFGRCPDRLPSNALVAVAIS